MRDPAGQSQVSATLEGQLDKLLVTRWITARWARRIWSVGELPAPLQHCARKLARGTAWRAYADDHQVYFVLGRNALPKGPEPLIEAYFLDANAALLWRGVWKFDAREGFELQEFRESAQCPAPTPAALLPEVPSSFDLPSAFQLSAHD